MGSSHPGLTRRELLAGGAALALACVAPSGGLALPVPSGSAPFAVPLVAERELERTYQVGYRGERITGWSWAGGSLRRSDGTWILQIDGFMAEALDADECVGAACLHIRDRCPERVWLEWERDWLQPGAGTSLNWRQRSGG